MNLREMPRVTMPPLPNPKDTDQRKVNQQLVDSLKLLFQRDSDKEQRLRKIEFDEV